MLLDGTVPRLRSMFSRSSIFFRKPPRPERRGGVKFLLRKFLVCHGSSGGGDRFAVRALFVLGAIAVVLAAAPYRIFDLDRFFAPKELALHAAALALVLLTLRRVKTLELNRIDLLLSLYLSLSFASALFASDHWLSTRALAVTLSGAGVFWAARAAANDGGRRMIVAAAAAAAVMGAAASLTQAYGATSDFFSLNRIPGGTLGNRNFMAHLAALCAPALIHATITARRSVTAACGAAGMTIIAAALVLSRSRAAYLGLAVGAMIFTYGFWLARSRWSDPITAFRIKCLVLAAASGILAALLLPNTLEWRSESPYIDTVAGMVDYRRGSGHGRVVQYARTLRITASHPLLGAGPGNWAVIYPKVAAPYDPSINHANGTTANPWPSSDWMAILSERGAPALAAILLALLGLLAGAWRKAAHAAGIEEYSEGLTLTAVLSVTAVVACFDAVLLLPAPSFIVWSLFGALAAFSPPRWSAELSQRALRRLTAAVALVGTAAVLRSSGQIAAMALSSKARSAAQCARAARLDPGNARIRSRCAALRAAALRRPDTDPGGPPAAACQNLTPEP